MLKNTNVFLQGFFWQCFSYGGTFFLKIILQEEIVKFHQFIFFSFAWCESSMCYIYYRFVYMRLKIQD